MFPGITQHGKAWKTLKQGQYPGVGSWQLILCELLPHFQWCAYGSLGIWGQSTGQSLGTVQHGTGSPALLGLCACWRSRTHFVLNFSDCSKGKIKIHLLQEVGFVITKGFFKPLKPEPSWPPSQLQTGDILFLNYANGTTKPKNFLLSFSICIKHTFPFLNYITLWPSNSEWLLLAEFHHLVCSTCIWHNKIKHSLGNQIAGMFLFLFQTRRRLTSTLVPLMLTFHQ